MSTSYVSVSDMFCGAGGSTTGITQAGGEVVLAMNHWQRAIETHHTNYPQTTHVQADIMNADPRRFPRTTMLVASPECTNHSIAKGRQRKDAGQPDLWQYRAPDPAEERSRCTMWCPLRFAEYHRYEYVILENVCDIRFWVMFDAWVQAWKSLGYRLQFVYLNSMFVHPTPQNRDRVYIVASREGNPKPDLSITPLAYCSKCGKDQHAVQSWKNPMKPYGKYGKNGQYLYCCPECASVVTPYYYAAANAIDWSIPATRIGDRAKPLEPKTMRRIQIGLEKQLRSPYLMSLSHGSHLTAYVKSVEQPYPTQTTRQDVGLVTPPFILEMHDQYRSRPITEPLSTVCAGTINQYLIEPFIAEMHGTSTAHSTSEPLATVCASAIHHALVTPPPPFLVNCAHGGAADPTDIRIYSTHDRPMPTMCAGGIQHGLVVPDAEHQAYLMSYYSNGTLLPISEAVGTITTKDRHALITQEAPEPRVEDCGFRMLRPHEVKRAMAFPSNYVITGTQKEQVKQLGNAVTPPVMKLLAERCIAALEGKN